MWRERKTKGKIKLEGEIAGGTDWAWGGKWTGKEWELRIKSTDDCSLVIRPSFPQHWMYCITGTRWCNTFSAAEKGGPDPRLRWLLGRERKLRERTRERERERVTLYIHTHLHISAFVGWCYLQTKHNSEHYNRNPVHTHAVSHRAYPLTGSYIHRDVVDWESFCHILVLTKISHYNITACT